MCVCVCVCVNVYIYRERESQRVREVVRARREEGRGGGYMCTQMYYLTIKLNYNRLHGVGSRPCPHRRDPTLVETAGTTLRQSVTD